LYYITTTDLLSGMIKLRVPRLVKKPPSWRFFHFRASLICDSSVGDIPSIPGELFAKFQTSFFSDPVDAVYKALGVE